MPNAMLPQPSHAWSDARRVSSTPPPRLRTISSSVLRRSIFQLASLDVQVDLQVHLLGLYNLSSKIGVVGRFIIYVS